MQVNPTQTGTANAPTVGTAVRVTAGDLAALPVGQLVRATVSQVLSGAAILTVNGQPLTVKPAAGLTPGDVLLVRVPGGAARSLDLIGKAAPAASAPASGAAATARPTTLAAVDVLSAVPDGRFVVRIDGREEVATSTAELTPGGRYVVEVDRTPTGLALRPPTDAPNLPDAVATALLRGSKPPDLGAALKPLLAELAAIHQNGGGPSSPILRDAAGAVRDAVNGFLPSDHPPDEAQLRSLVEDGGLHYEAKLTRLASGGEGSTDPAAAVRGDLKGALLQLLRAAHDLGATASVPAAQTTLDGVEAQQAANVLAQNNAGPYVLQVPFPDAGTWRTLHLAVESDRGGKPEADQPGGFRLLMHVPLTELGETWIDAGLSGNRFRAVLYLDQTATRDRVRTELPGLRTELLSDGFAEVLLDVRPAGDLPARRRQQAAMMQAGRLSPDAVLDVRA